MNFVPHNPNKPVCEDCERACPVGCMSLLVPECCALCAIVRLAAIDLERALDFRALSHEHFVCADKYAALDDLDETIQLEVDALDRDEAREATFYSDDMRVAL